MRSKVVNWSLVFGLAWLAMWPAVLCAAEVRVAVASNFLLPLQSIARAYEQQSGDRLRISAGSTGKLYAQIINGAPFDVFLAANHREPERLEQGGQGVAGSRFTYALGQLTLWAPQRAAAPRDMLATLKADDFRRLALANPATAPYGAAAVEVLDRLDLKDQLQGKLIRGESIGQAYQYVASGAAEMGFVALSQLLARGDQQRGAYWTIDSTLHSPIRQQALLLRRGANNPAAQRFLAYLQNPAGRAAIQAFGYGLETP